MRSGEPLELTWLAWLAAARTPEELGEAIASLTRDATGCTSAHVLWQLEDARHYRSAPAVELTSSDWAWLCEAAESDVPHWHGEGHRAAIRLCLKPETVLLLLNFPVDRSGSHPFANLMAPLQLAGQHLARALEWAALKDSHHQLERSDTLQRALFAISDLAGSAHSMPDMLRGIHAIVSTLMYAENFFIVLFNVEQHLLRFVYLVDVEDATVPGDGKDVPLSAIEHSLTWYVLHDGKARMGNPEELEKQVGGPLVLIGKDSEDWLGVPMLRDGQARGALVVQSYRPGISFREEDRALLEFVGSHILTAVERRRVSENLEKRVELRTRQLAEANRGLQLEINERQRAEQLQATLFKIAQLATADIDQNEFYRRVHAAVSELLNAENFFIALISDDHKRLMFPYAVDAVKLPPSVRMLGRGLSEYVLRHGVALRASNADIEALERAGEIASGRYGAPSQSWLGVPLVVDDLVIGLVTVQSYDVSVTYSEADQELLSFAALQIANSLARRRSAASLRLAYEQLEHRVEERTHALRKEIVERERMQAQLRHQVMHDALTGLPNRDYLRARIDRVLATHGDHPGHHCALLYLDVDRFKIINDSLGHLAGDGVLKEVAIRLAGCLRHPDLVARLSGDEFVIFLESVESSDVATGVAQRVMAALARPLRLAEKELQITVSIGIALGDERYLAADELMRDADIALYQAKKLGRKRFELFDEAMAKNVVDVLTMEVELRQALQQHEFEPYLQPIFQLDDGQVVGYEALLRWNHLQHGLRRPDDFLKVAEDSGLIESIDWHMFELSCRALAQSDPPGAPFITLNVSALHLRHADFDEQLLALLQRAGLAPTQVIVEVTEGALLDDPERVRGTLERLLAAGVGAALDDFGTGYSSLSYLHSLPLRILKIDQSFVQELGQPDNINSTTVVEAILALARALNIRVIAEGIETQAQHDALRAMGCELGQGFLMGRPAPVSTWLGPAVS